VTPDVLPEPEEHDDSCPDAADGEDPRIP
jgi:hypothetical protein